MYVDYLYGSSVEKVSYMWHVMYMTKQLPFSEVLCWIRWRLLLETHYSVFDYARFLFYKPHCHFNYTYGSTRNVGMVLVAL